MAGGALYGGPSYQYSYQELDPTELQYLRGQELQESQQFQHLGQSDYQVNQSYSQSYWQRYHRPSLQQGMEQEKPFFVSLCLIY